MPESGILDGDVAPQAPAAAGADFGIPVGGVVLVAVDGALGAASVGDEDQVVLREHDSFFHAFYLALDGFRYLFAVLFLKYHIGDFGAELEVHAGVLQVLLHGQDQGFVLVVLGELQGAEVRQARDMVDEALEVQLHLQGAVPVLESEHGAPVQPEGGVEDFLIEHVLDGLVVQVFVPGHEQLHDFHCALLA